MTIDADTLRQMIAEDELGLLELPVKPRAITGDDRLVTGFGEITEFVREHGREPELNPVDMGESKLHWRLEGLRAEEAQRELLAEYDEFGLLVEPEPPSSIEDVLASDDSGLLDDPTEIFEMRNVPKVTAAPDKVAQREPCKDFDKFQPLFELCHAELRKGTRRLIEFRNEQQIEQHKFYVLNGVLVYVAAVGERQKTGGKVNARLRCIFENGTESDMLLRSLSRGLYKDGKSVTEPTATTLKRMGLEPGTPMGTVYVLRSLSDDPEVAAIPNLHKIGFTTGTSRKRVAGASKDETFLGAPVEIVAEYEMPAGIARHVEGLLHRFFASARIDAWFERGGATTTEMQEWFSVPLPAIDEAMKLIEAETIQNYEYDREAGTLGLQKA